MFSTVVLYYIVRVALLTGIVDGGQKEELPRNLSMTSWKRQEKTQCYSIAEYEQLSRSVLTSLGILMNIDMRMTSREKCELSRNVCGAYGFDNIFIQDRISGKPELKKAKCYLILLDMIYAQFANIDCKRRGGDPVSIESEKEQLHIKKTIGKYFAIPWIIWTGGVRWGNRFIWLASGKEIGFTNLALGYPRVTIDRFIALRTTDYKWISTRVDLGRVLCQKEVKIQRKFH